MRWTSLWVACWLAISLSARVLAGGLNEERIAPEAVTPRTAEAAEFFEREVRPVLVHHCFRCHGPERQEQGLRLDSSTGLRKGSDKGSVVVSGDAEQSRLIRAIGYGGAIKMPPPGKLPQRAIEALTAWVKLGAPWPTEASAAAAKVGAISVAEARRRHWAFQPVKKPPIPEVTNRDWPATPIDHLILAKLEEAGMQPSPPADRRTLIRRASFDLLGLPPAPEDVDAFVRDTAPDAFARLVDRLLASPHYGERWGRYWLDVARYADTKGYVYAGEERRYPFSHVYRDYVIRAFNEDLPYNQFLLQQLAADCLPLGSDKRPLAALGFLTLGRRFVNNVHDVIDDRLDVIFRGTQALSVACARCHDHKYDPIPTKDYYSLYGVLAASTERTVPLTEAPEPTAEYLAYAKELRGRQQALDQALETKRAELSERLRGKVTEYLIAVREAQKLPGDDFYVIMGPDDLNPLIVRGWQAYLDQRGKTFDPIFAPWHAFAAIPEKEFAARALALAQAFAANREANGQLNPIVAQAFTGSTPASMREVAERYGRLLEETDKAWKAAVETAAKNQAAAPPALADPNQEALRQVLYAPDSPVNVPPVRIGEIETFFDEDTRTELNKLQQKVDAWHLEAPGASPHALILEDRPVPYNPRVFLRGNPSNRGEEVPRQFLEVLAGEGRKAFLQGSGRLELAEAIASPDNPLTARVMVNRIWLHHFGEGLVRTPSDFGARSQPPTHPELLDYLAWRFMEEGWSIKKLHRLIMLSSVYQESGNEQPEYRRRDPENRLLWRMNRRRLDFEALRDSLLSVAGQLDATLGGRPVEITAPAPSKRRAIYGLIDRQNLPGVLRVFDFANPDTHSPQRHVTTTAQQALFMMNSPFAIDQGRALIRRADVRNILDPAARIGRLYALAYQRAPTASELELGLRFLDDAQSAEPDKPAPRRRPLAWQYGYGEVDEAAQRVKTFQALPHFTGTAWQGGPQLPDPKTGWVFLNAEGGHAGNDAQHAAIRRWLAPREGVVAIQGTVAHAASQGDGIRARIVSSRGGVLGSWTVHNGTQPATLAEAEVQPGDTIDFVVDCGGSVEHDEFQWAPSLRYVSLAPPETSEEWDAARDFHGPLTDPPQPLDAWEKYAQVLLLANEFVFVD